MAAGVVAAAGAASCGDGSGGSGGKGGKGGSAGGAGGAGGGLTTVELRGQYLVDHVFACGDCHTPQGPTGPVAGKYLAGNADFVALPTGDKLGSRNLTNDATGLKNRSDDEIKNMFRNGTRPAATGSEPLNPIMPYYVFHNVTDADADAIVAYLRTVPAVVNDIPRRGATFDVPRPCRRSTTPSCRCRRPPSRRWRARRAAGTWPWPASSATPSTSWARPPCSTR